MALNDHEFQINDVVLNIPPEQITITRRTSGESIPVLRSRTAPQIKSSYTEIQIQCLIKFTDSGNGLKKLRDLISQFRVTPICYVSNKHLRDTIFNGGTSNMALILSDLLLTKNAEDGLINVITAEISFFWFNYFPFSKDFMFKKDIYIPEPVKDPAQSIAWQRLYQAEQNKRYLLPTGLENGEPRLNPYANTSLSFNQFKIFKGEYLNKLQEVQSVADQLLTSARLINTNQQATDAGRAINNIKNDLIKTVGEEKAHQIVEELFGNTTSMKPEEILQTYQKFVSDALPVQGDAIKISPWKEIKFNDGPDNLGMLDLTTTVVDKVTNPDHRLAGRSITISSNTTTSPLICNSISIAFRPTLAVIPMTGHVYPTYQYTGNMNISVSVNFLCNQEKALTELSYLLSATEEQNLKGKKIPFKARNIRIADQIVNLCGLYEFVIEHSQVDTVPGSPGLSNVSISLIHNDVDVLEQEKLQQESKFISTTAIRQVIADILTRNIKPEPNATKSQTTIRDKSVSAGGVSRTFHQTNYSATLKTDQDRDKLSQLAGELENAGRATLGLEKKPKNIFSNYYYSGIDDNGTEAFKSLSKEFATGLDDLTIRLRDAFVDGIIASGEEARSYLKEFLSLKNDDVYAIELVQEALKPLINDIAVGTKLVGSNQNFNSNTSIEDYKKLATEDLNAAVKAYEDKTKKKDPTSENEFSKIHPFARKQMFVRNYTQEWTAFVNGLTTRIITSDFLYLDQFKKARDLLESVNNVGIEGSCYKDFPIAQVFANMEQDQRPEVVSQLNGLRDAAARNGLGGRTVSLTSMCNPDFYFYEDVLDIKDSIIPVSLISEVADGVIETYKESRPDVEKDWFQGIYQNRILDQKTNQLIANNIEVGKTKDPKFWNSKEGESYASKYEDDRKNESQYTPHSLYGNIRSAITDYDKIELKKIDNEDAKENYTTSRRTASTMQASKQASEITHVFDIESIKANIVSNKPLVVYDPNKTPNFKWPTPEGTRYIKSNFGPRTPPDVIGDDGKARKGSAQHQGIDIVGPESGACAGKPVTPAAEGWISAISKKESPSSTAGYNIAIEHPGGWLTKYFHLQWDKHIEKISNGFHNNKSSSTKYNVTPETRIGSIGDTATKGAFHLHFETHVNGQPVNPQDVLNGDYNKAQGPVLSTEFPQDSLLARSAADLNANIKKGYLYGMRRAYPTFRLYFIESDLGERRTFGADELFSYSAVSDIQVIRNKKIAADLVTITLSNLSGRLSSNRTNKDISNRYVIGAQNSSTGSNNINQESRGNANTEYENPLSNILLQPGIQIQLRFGYHNNPFELDTVFNGVITNVQFTETDDVVQIVAQSYAIELTQTVQGEVKKFGGFLSNKGRTGVILEELLASPEVRHFGRWEVGSDSGSTLFRELVTNRFTIKPQPQDDNIFAPGGRGLWGLLDSTTLYLMYNTTSWDIFQEMTLRHPGYIAAAVPYDGADGPRMTMFFGLPDQAYLARDPTYAEQTIVRKLKSLTSEAVKKIQDNKEVDTLMDATNNLDLLKASLNSFGVAPATLADDLKNLNTITKKQDAAKVMIENTLKAFARKVDIVRPFRSYHILTSNNCIMYNSIHSNADVFNTVTIGFSQDSAKIDDDTTELKVGDPDTFTLRCDAGLIDEDVRELYETYPNCVGYETAKLYAVGRLKQSLEQGYGGSLIIIGNPTIKPHDICYIFDEYNDMFGAIEVEQVVHRMSSNNGFITEITPNMIVHVNQWSTIGTSDAMGYIAEAALKEIGMPSLRTIQDLSQNSAFAVAGTSAIINAAIGAGLTTAGLAAASSGLAITAGAAFFAVSNWAFAPIANAFFNAPERTNGQGANVSAVGLIGAFVFRKLITKTQLAHPFRYSTLNKNGKPLIGGLPSRRTDGSFITELKTMYKEGVDGRRLLMDKIQDSYLNVEAWYNPQGSLSKTLFGE